ncbi:MAG: hypothetical protein ACE15B_13420 [Bryobacteraceae bacterium]
MNQRFYAIVSVFFLAHAAPSRDDSSLVPMTNEEIVRRLERECEGVQFVVRDATGAAKLPEVLNEMKDFRKLHDAFIGFRLVEEDA